MKLVIGFLATVSLSLSAFAATNIVITKNGQNVTNVFAKEKYVFVFSADEVAEDLKWSNKLGNQAEGCQGVGIKNQYFLTCASTGPLSVEVSFVNFEGTTKTTAIETEVKAYTDDAHGKWAGNTEQAVQEFRITDGTAQSNWNGLANTVQVYVGQTLKIFNDDKVNHQLHTNGTPCGHGNLIAPGTSQNCVIKAAHNSVLNGGMYDHLTNGKFHVIAIDGAAIYKSSCMGCHKEPEKHKDFTSEKILKARSTVAKMLGNPGVQKLTDDELKAVGYFLVNQP